MYAARSRPVAQRGTTAGAFRPGSAVLAPAPPAVDADDDEEDLPRGLAVERRALAVAERLAQEDGEQQGVAEMPIGQVQTLRHIPSRAEARPKTLPTISR